jgi:hypothetical protein
VGEAGQVAQGAGEGGVGVAEVSAQGECGGGCGVWGHAAKT